LKYRIEFGFEKPKSVHLWSEGGQDSRPTPTLEIVYERSQGKRTDKHEALKQSTLDSHKHHIVMEITFLVITVCYLLRNKISRYDATHLFNNAV